MRRGAQLLIAGGGLGVLALGLFMLSIRFALVPKPQRTVSITNATDHTVKVGYRQSWDNTWHTAAGTSKPVAPGESRSYRYQKGDSVWVGEIAPRDGSMDGKQRAEHERVQSSIDLDRETALRVVMDAQSGELRLETAQPSP